MTRSPISVVIPTYNRARMIGAAVDSVLNQARDDDEIIVVDDGSTDNTSEVVAGYGDRLVYIKQPNAGAGMARNRGIAAARHDLIAFLDSDDEFLPGKMDLQGALMDARPDVVYSFGEFKVRHADGRLSPRFLKNWHHDPRPWSELLDESIPLSSLAPIEGGEDVAVYIGSMYEYEMAANYIATFTTMVRRSLAGEALYFTEGVSLYEDWGCFGRLAGVGPGAFIDAELAINGGHVDGRLTDADMYHRAIARVVVLEEVWGSDLEFQQQHGERYRQILEGQRLIKAAGLINEGRTAEARLTLSKVSNAPLAHKLVASLPGSVARVLLGTRRLVGRLVGRG